MLSPYSEIGIGGALICCVIAKRNREATEKLVLIQKVTLSDVVALKPLYGHITIATYITRKSVFTGGNDANFI